MVRNRICPHCGTKFSRPWNMERHIKLKHSGRYEVSKQNQFGNPYVQYQIPSNSKLSHDNSPEIARMSGDGLFSGFSQMQDRMKSLKELKNMIQEAGSGNPTNVINDLQPRLNSVTNQLSSILSNYWLIPKQNIFGISGYFCKRCLSFDSDFIRDPGYDMTAESKHRCDENKVSNIRAVSIRQSDINNRDNFFAGALLKSVNKFIPNKKYLIGTDVTELFNHLTKSYNKDLAKSLLGIPDRYCLYTYNESNDLNWLNRALENIDKKTMMEEDEVVDFLRRVKSSYAMFEILTSNTPKMVMLSLTA